MLIRRFTFTILTFVFLIFSLYAEGMIFQSNSVSPETASSIAHFSVKQGVSQDGRVTVMRVSDAPQIPPREKTSNKPRTLRAFIGANNAGIPTVFVESVKPHEYYSVTGAFSVSPAYTTLTWLNPNLLVFYVLSNESGLVRAQLDVRTLSLFTQSVDEAQISTSTELINLETIL